jgi:orotidine-5'-phosphate decarboxylase
VSFIAKLVNAVETNNTLLCVGLDPDLSRIPEQIRAKSAPVFEFNKAIVDATHDLVCAFKPNSAFYERLGADGEAQLKQTIKYIKETYPDIPVILDSKRGDVESTNLAYADAVFGYLGVDAVTLQPYLGGEALEPFLSVGDKGSIILCKTSNPGASEFQDLAIDGEPMYLRVARNFSTTWNTNNNVLLVVGATYPAELAAVRQITGPDMYFLVPGVGAQGGDIAEVMKAGLGKDKRGLIVNSSRNIIYASDSNNFAEAARQAAIKTRDEINKYR